MSFSSLFSSCGQRPYSQQQQSTSRYCDGVLYNEEPKMFSGKTFFVTRGVDPQTVHCICRLGGCVVAEGPGFSHFPLGSCGATGYPYYSNEEHEARRKRLGNSSSSTTTTNTTMDRKNNCDGCMGGKNALTTTVARGSIGEKRPREESQTEENTDASDRIHIDAAVFAEGEYCYHSTFSSKCSSGISVAATAAAFAARRIHPNHPLASDPHDASTRQAGESQNETRQKKEAEKREKEQKRAAAEHHRRVVLSTAMRSNSIPVVTEAYVMLCAQTRLQAAVLPPLGGNALYTLHDPLLFSGVVFTTTGFASGAAAAGRNSNSNNNNNNNNSNKHHHHHDQQQQQREGDEKRDAARPRAPAHMKANMVALLRYYGARYLAAMTTEVNLLVYAPLRAPSSCSSSSSFIGHSSPSSVSSFSSPAAATIRSGQQQQQQEIMCTAGSDGGGGTSAGSKAVAGHCSRRASSCGFTPSSVAASASSPESAAAGSAATRTAGSGAGVQEEEGEGRLSASPAALVRSLSTPPRPEPSGNGDNNNNTNNISNNNGNDSPVVVVVSRSNERDGERTECTPNKLNGERQSPAPTRPACPCCGGARDTDGNACGCSPAPFADRLAAARHMGVACVTPQWVMASVERGVRLPVPPPPPPLTAISTSSASASASSSSRPLSSLPHSSLLPQPSTTAAETAATAADITPPGDVAFPISSASHVLAPRNQPVTALPLPGEAGQATNDETAKEGEEQTVQDEPAGQKPTAADDTESNECGITDSHGDDDDSEEEEEDCDSSGDSVSEKSAALSVDVTVGIAARRRLEGTSRVAKMVEEYTTTREAGKSQKSNKNNMNTTTTMAGKAKSDITRSIVKGSAAANKAASVTRRATANGVFARAVRDLTPAAEAKRHPGRPKGSKNKKRDW